MYIILNGAQNFKFIGFIYATLIGWILYTFQDTSTKLGYVLILRKREDQALISISTILKFSAQASKALRVTLSLSLQKFISLMFIKKQLFVCVYCLLHTVYCILYPVYCILIKLTILFFDRFSKIWQIFRN